MSDRNGGVAVTRNTYLIEVGKTYLVTHPWKGTFTLHVWQTDADFTGGIVLGSSPPGSGSSSPSFLPPGSQVIVLNAQCAFRPAEPTEMVS